MFCMQEEWRSKPTSYQAQNAQSISPGTRFLQQTSVNTLIKKLLRIFILKSLLVDSPPLSVSKGVKQISCVSVKRHLHKESRAPTHANQIEFSFLGEHPLFEHIVDFKLAVRWDSGVWWRGKVHACTNACGNMSASSTAHTPLPVPTSRMF